MQFTKLRLRLPRGKYRIVSLDAHCDLEWERPPPSTSMLGNLLNELLLEEILLKNRWERLLHHERTPRTSLSGPSQVIAFLIDPCCDHEHKYCMRVGASPFHIFRCALLFHLYQTLRWRRLKPTLLSNGLFSVSISPPFLRFCCTAEIMSSA